MKVEYAGGSNLYVPATQLDVIQKYADSQAKRPKLNKLGTQEWGRTKTKVRSADQKHRKRSGAALCGETAGRGILLWRGHDLAERVRRDVSV